MLFSDIILMIYYIFIINFEYSNMGFLFEYQPKRTNIRIIRIWSNHYQGQWPSLNNEEQIGKTAQKQCARSTINILDS